MDYKEKTMKKIKTLLILFIFSNLVNASILKDIGTDIGNVLYEGRIGFGMTYEYNSTGLEFPYKEDINLNYLNTDSLSYYYGDYTTYEKFSYYITARPTSRLSLRWDNSFIGPYTTVDTSNSLFKNYKKIISQLSIDYYIFPRWSLYAVIANQTESSSVVSTFFTQPTLLSEENQIYKIPTKVSADSITLGTKISPDWGQFNIYNIINYVYNYPPTLYGLPTDAISGIYEDINDNFLKKENDFNIAYYLNPSVKLDISGLYQNRVSYSNKTNGVYNTDTFVQYPFEVKYRLTEIWELGVKVHNESNKSINELQKKETINQVELWRSIKDNFEKKYNSSQLSLSRYFKYQGLNIYGKFMKFSQDYLYEYQENILYGEEKSVLWSRWDQSIFGYALEGGFYYRPIMEKLYVSVGIRHNFPSTTKKPLPAYYTSGFYDYSFSAFYKPTALFEVKAEKGFRNMSEDYKIPQEVFSLFKRNDVWNIEKNSFSQTEEREKVAIALRTTLFTVEGAIEQTSVGVIYYKKEDALLSDRFIQPWAYSDIFKKYITYNIGYSYTTQALFSGSQLTISGGLYYKPDYTYYDGSGGEKTVNELSYLFNVRYEFTPTFYIEAEASEGHYFEKTTKTGLAAVGSILSKEDLHSYNQYFKLNIVYRP